MSLAKSLSSVIQGLPTPLKVALPATIIASPLVAGQGAGIAAFGSAIGVPVLLIIFLGTAGITSVIEAFLGKPEARNYISVVMAMIARDEILRRARYELREAMAAEPVKPKRYQMPKEAEALQAKLMAMDPYDFERHVMSFFQDAGMLAWVTKKSNDAGVDGFARHSNGLILVQCKRHGPTNFIGRPVIQQQKGVIEENDAWRGYVVTTSRFTKDAIDSAKLSNKVFLIDMEMLTKWHKKGFSLKVQDDLEPFEYRPTPFFDDLQKMLPKEKVKELDKLRKIRDKGFISDEEFDKAVEKLIA